MRQLLEQWAQRLAHFALRLTLDPHEAEDLTQETLLRAWKNQSQLRDQNRIRVWLFRIMANLWRDRLRQKQAVVHQVTSLESEPLSSGLSPDEIVEKREECQRVLQSLDQLPTRQRETLYLNTCEGLHTREISEILEISLSAVKANLSLARKKMREQIHPGATQQS